MSKKFNSDKAKRINRPPSGFVYTEDTPVWLSWIAPEEFNDADLFRIVVFYVFHSPCEGLSSQHKPVTEYNWNNPWGKPEYLNKKLKLATNNPNLIHSSETWNDMIQAATNANVLDDKFTTELTTERVCIYNNKRNQTLSMFYHIRNAFAHSRLNMRYVDNECVFIMEDRRPSIIQGEQQYRVSARMVLKKLTLLKWIDIIESGYTGGK